MKKKTTKRFQVPKLEAYLRRVFKASEVPAAKSVKEIEGVFYAYDERGHLTGIFGRNFANALREYGPMLEQSANPPMCIASAAPEPDRTIRVYLVARSFRDYQYFLERRREKFGPPEDRSFTYVQSAEQLDGLRFDGRSLRLATLFGWRMHKDEAFVSAIMRKLEEQRDTRLDRF